MHRVGLALGAHRTIRAECQKPIGSTFSVTGSVAFSVASTSTRSASSSEVAVTLT